MLNFVSVVFIFCVDLRVEFDVILLGGFGEFKIGKKLGFDLIIVMLYRVLVFCGFFINVLMLGVIVFLVKFGML